MLRNRAVQQDYDNSLTSVAELFGFWLLSSCIMINHQVYSLVLKTSLAFLLVFRLNRCAMQYWESRTIWGIYHTQYTKFSRTTWDQLRGLTLFVLSTMSPNKE